MSQKGPAGVVVTAQSAADTVNLIKHPIDFAHRALGIAYLTPDQEAVLDAVYKNFRVAVTSGHSVGKALALDTPLPTPTGWATMGSVEPGDKLFDENGSVTTIVAVSPTTTRTSYRVTLDDGTSVVASDNHLWTVLSREKRKRPRRKRLENWRDLWSACETVTTEHLAKTTKMRNGRRWISRWVIPNSLPLCGENNAVSIPPYTLGFWLGDGDSAWPAITVGTSDQEEVLSKIRADGITVRSRPSRCRAGSGSFALLGVVAAFRAEDLLHNKHIPSWIFRANLHVRMEVLRGLMDSDGYGSKAKSGSAFITLSDRRLFLDVLELIRTFGWPVSVCERRPKGQRPNWTACFRAETVPFCLSRKVARFRPGAIQVNRRSARSVVSVEPIGSVPVKCVTVSSPRGLFLAGDGLVPTHNSHLAAILTLWFLYTRYPSKCLTTAASWPQVEDVLWREIRSMYKNAPSPLGGRLMNTQLDLEELWFAQGRSTDDSTNLQGFHSKHVLMLLDEATGIDPKIWEAAQTMAINPETDRIVALGNPTDSTSRFFEECHIAGKWTHLEVSCENHPNVLENKIIIPGAVTREWVDQYAAEFGRDHPIYEARVLGKWSLKLGRMFPDFDPLVGGAHVYKAGTEEHPEWLPKWIGIDWGYAHDTAAYLLAWDGNMTWVMDEICVSGRTPGEIGTLIADSWGRYKIEAVYLSHEAMNRTESPKSRAMMMQEAWAKKKIPRAQRADTDRIGRWNLMTQLFRTNKIKVSSSCKKLVAALVKAVRNPDKPEDMLKQEGDDPVDALGYALKSSDKSIRVPKEELLRRAVEPAVKRGDHMGAFYLRMKHIEKERRRKPNAIKMSLNIHERRIAALRRRTESVESR